MTIDAVYSMVESGDYGVPSSPALGGESLTDVTGSVNVFSLRTLRLILFNRKVRKGRKVFLYY